MFSEVTKDSLAQSFYYSDENLENFNCFILTGEDAKHVSMRYADMMDAWERSSNYYCGDSDLFQAACDDESANYSNFVQNHIDKAGYNKYVLDWDDNFDKPTFEHIV